MDGPYSPRLILAYVRHMPPGSATAAALQGGDQFTGWDGHLHMLANIVDAIRENTHVLVSVNSKRKPKPPEPVYRPQAKKKTNPAANRFAAMARAAYLKSMRKADG